MSIALGIPPFIALTKADLASEVAVQQVAAEIRWVISGRALGASRCGGAGKHAHEDAEPAERCRRCRRCCPAALVPAMSHSSV